MIADALAYLGLVAGWCLITWGLAALLRRWEVVALSAGIFLIGMVGLRVVAVIFMDGLYLLSRGGRNA